MTDVFKVADVLVNNIKKKYAEDIAIAAYYGSYALGKAHAKSDLDFFFIPATDKAYGAMIQFILDDIGFDFWPISWKRAERMADFDDMVTIIADSKIIYSRSEDDLARFNALRDRISEMQKPENKKIMLDKAFSRLKNCYMFLYNLQTPDCSKSLTAARIEAYKLATTVLQSLAHANQAYFKRGWGQNMDEVLALKAKPDNLEMLLNTIMTERRTEKIVEASIELVNRTKQLLANEQKSFADKPILSELFNGFFEEYKGGLNKIISACEKKDYPTAFFASITFQKELSNFLTYSENGLWPQDYSIYSEYSSTYNSLGLPDWIELLEEGKFDELKTAVLEVEEKLRKMLVENGIKLKEFDSIENLEAYIKN